MRSIQYLDEISTVGSYMNFKNNRIWTYIKVNIYLDLSDIMTIENY